MPPSPETLSAAETHSEPLHFARLKAAGKAVGRTAALAAGIWLGVNFGGGSTIESGPLRFEVDAKLASPFDAHEISGFTELSIPPLGSVELDTHDSPFDVYISPSGIDSQKLAVFGDDPHDSLDSFRKNLAVDIEEAKNDLLRKKMLQAGAGLILAGGGLIAFDQFRRRQPGKDSLRKLIVPFSAVCLLGAGFAGATMHSIDGSSNAIQHASYHGLLSSAPEIIGNVYDTAEKFNEQTQQLADIITYLGQLIDSYQNILVLPDDVINVLFVSDIHSQYGTFDLIQRSIEQFQVDLIIDGGDLTDRGARPEQIFFEQIGSLGVPYVFVRGNHDSPSTIQSLREIPNVVILGGQTQEVEGLSIVGSPDLRYTPDLSRPRNDEQALRYQAAGLAQAILRSSIDPTVAVVHDPRAARLSYGLVPYILSGHTHHQDQHTQDGTLHIISGSTGGGGLRAYAGGEGIPRTAQVLSFSPDGETLVQDILLNFGRVGETRSSVQVCDAVEQQIAC